MLCKLIARYTNDMALLDATYHTTRYALPLFFIAMKSNFDYQSVGLFVRGGNQRINIVDPQNSKGVESKMEAFSLHDLLL